MQSQTIQSEIALNSAKKSYRLRRIVVVVAGLLVLMAVAALAPFVYLSNTRPMQVISIPVGNYAIQGYLYPGEDEAGNWVVFVHGNRSEGQASELYQVVLNNLSRQVGVLAIDLYGFGQSTFADQASDETVFDRSADVRAAVEYLQTTYGLTDDQIILMGHSLGASQIVQAAKGHDYRKLISIAPGDYSQLIDDPQVFEGYLDKLKENTGMAPSADDLRDEVLAFMPENLFSPCPSTPIVLMGGQYEHDDGLFRHQDKIPANCLADMEIVTIPLSNHMYGTEGIYLPGPLSVFHRVVQPVHSRIEMSLLVSELNRLLTT